MVNVAKPVRSLIAGSALLLSAAAGLFALPASAAEHNWRFSNLYGRGTAFGELYEHLGKNIEQLSGGKIKVQVMYSGEGVDSKNLLNAVKTGLITMGAPFQPMNAGEMPAGVIEVGLPGGTSDTDKLYNLFHTKGWGKVLEKAYASQGLVWLEPYMQPAVYIITKQPINSVEDFKGLKIRAPGAYGKFLRHLGASPVSLAWSEIYTSLATGVIDGAIGSNMIDHRDGNHVEVATYMYPLPLAGAQVLPVVVNNNAWKKLTPELQAAVRKATEIHAREQLIKSREWEAEAVTEMEAKGLQWSPEPSEEDKKLWRAAGATLWDEYSAKDRYSKQLIDILRQES